MAVRAWRVAIAWALFCSVTAPATAQGLLWNLPEDGTEVVYGGTLTQTDTRPDGQQNVMRWDRELLIRSVGRQDVQHEGQTIPARWIEFELRTGRATERGIDPGPVGTRIYRVLVPEAAVTGQAADERGIPNVLLPIMEGYVQVTNQQPQRLATSAFQTYPTLSLLMNYKPNELTLESESEPVSTVAGQFSAAKYSAEAVVESPTSRVENQATFFVSPEMPFGLVRWTAIIDRSAKEPNQSRDAYEPMSRVECEMEARAINRNARSALTVPAR
jgi:hypothetical protein